jgi:hypothetical protein
MAKGVAQIQCCAQSPFSLVSRNNFGLIDARALNGIREGLRQQQRQRMRVEARESGWKENSMCGQWQGIEWDKEEMRMTETRRLQARLHPFRPNLPTC